MHLKFQSLSKWKIVSQIEKDFNSKWNKNSWQLKKRKLWYSQLNIITHFQAILDQVTAVIRFSKTVLCTALVSFETSIDGSWKRGADIEPQMLWAISFLQIHHIHHHLKSSKLCNRDIGQISFKFTTLKFIWFYHAPSLFFFFLEVGDGCWSRDTLWTFSDFSTENTIHTIESSLSTNTT